MRTRDYIDEISYILDVDFIPEDKAYYEAWPEPFKSEALQALKERQENFNQMSKDKLKNFE